MTIKAIETRYAGCRFRSRLEARWAVFFDRVGVEWEYEPQGFEVTYRLSMQEGTFQYLPDFWLPVYNAWGEVKGSLDDAETYRLLDAAASLSSNDGGGCHDNGGHDLVVLGPLTRSDWGNAPALLHMHKGDLEAGCLWCGPHTYDYRVVGQDSGLVEPFAADLLLRGMPCPLHSIEFATAYGYARSARFEHGERG